MIGHIVCRQGTAEVPMPDYPNASEPSGPMAKIGRRAATCSDKMPRGRDSPLSAVWVYFRSLRIRRLALANIRRVAAPRRWMPTRSDTPRRSIPPPRSSGSSSPMSRRRALPDCCSRSSILRELLFSTVSTSFRPVRSWGELDAGSWRPPLLLLPVVRRGCHLLGRRCLGRHDVQSRV
jgi:hypothetical protein